MPPTKTLRCLSIRQPWAWAICSGESTVENRTWSTDYRGLIAIHASATRSVVNSIRREISLPAEPFEYGAIIGLAELQDVVELDAELEANPWASGPYCWIVKNGRFLEHPIPYKGRLMLFQLDEIVAGKVLSQPTHQADLTVPPLRELAEAIRPKPEPEQTFVKLAFERMDQGDLAGVHEALDATLRIAPDFAYGMYLKGCLLYDQGDIVGAFEQFSEALQREPTYVDVYLTRGDAYLLRGELDQACSDFESAIHHEPTLARSYIGRATVWNAKKQFGPAVADCNKALTLDSNQPMAYFQRAVAQLGLGEFDLAIADATSAFDADPQLFSALQLRSEAHEAKGDKAKAKRDQQESERVERKLKDACD